MGSRQIRSRRRPAPAAPAGQTGGRILSRLFLVIGGIAVGLLLAEAIARMFGLAQMPTPRRAVYNGVSREWCCGPEIERDGVPRFEPSTSFQHCYSGRRRAWQDDAGCVTYRINAQGFRGDEFSATKAPGTYRVVVLGDSFTFGEGTPQSDIFPTRLAAALRSAAGGRDVEVINLGFPAADTGTEAAMYARVASALDPDWVVLQWNTNDYPTSQVQADHLRLIGAEYRDVFASPPALAWSRVLSFAVQQYRLQRISRDLIHVTAQDAEAGRAVLGGIGAIAEWAKTDGAEFTLLIFPELIRLNDYPYASILALVHQYADGRQIDTIDLLPALSANRDRDLWVHETDHHPNPIAHGIAADALAARGRQLLGR